MTVNDVSIMLRMGRSTVLKLLHTGTLTGVKHHACGSVCDAPTTCRQGTWDITEDALQAYLKRVTVHDSSRAG